MIRQIDETIVALIDPDFIFLKPLTTWMSPEDSVARGDGVSLEGLKLENGGWVRKGYPAGEVPHEWHEMFFSRGKRRRDAMPLQRAP